MDLTSLMMKNIIPAICALIVTIILAGIIAHSSKKIESDSEGSNKSMNLPGFLKAVCGPLTVIILLALRPLFKITIDPLPVGGFVCIIVTGKIKESFSIIEFQSGR